MKLYRIINASFWAIVAVALSIAVVIEWSSKAAPAQSLVMACAFYTAACAALCGVIDQTIQGK
jgi:hypothetical protein